jgi:hypothetical protein
MENSIDNTINENGAESISILEIIDNQLTILQTIYDMPTDSYDKQHEDIVKAMSLAFRVIQKAQVKLLKNL